MRNFAVYVGVLLLALACKSTEATRTDTTPVEDVPRITPPLPKNETPDTQPPTKRQKDKGNTTNTPSTETVTQKNYKLTWATAVLDQQNNLKVSWKINPNLPSGSIIHIFKVDDSSQAKTKLTQITDKESVEIAQGFIFPASPNYRNAIGTILLEFSHAQTPLNLPAEKVSVGYDYQTAWGIKRPSPNYVPKVDMNCHPNGQEPSATPLSCDKFSTFFTKASLRKENQTYFVQRQNPNNFPIVYYLHESAENYRAAFEEVIEYYNEVAQKLSITQSGQKFIQLSEQILQGDTNKHIDKNSIEIGDTKSRNLLGEAFTAPNPTEVPTAGYLYKGEIVDADIKLYNSPISYAATQVYTKRTNLEAPTPGNDLNKILMEILKRTFSHELMHALGVNHNYEDKPYRSIMGSYHVDLDNLDAVDFNYELNDKAGEDYDLQTLRYLYTDYYEKNPKEFEALTFKVLRKETE